MLGTTKNPISKHSRLIMLENVCIDIPRKRLVDFLLHYVAADIQIKISIISYLGAIANYHFSYMHLFTFTLYIVPYIHIYVRLFFSPSTVT